MLTNREPTDRENETRRYLVQCEGCSFEDTVDGRESATAVGTDHHRETRHEVLALELPPSLDSS